MSKKVSKIKMPVFDKTVFHLKIHVTSELMVSRMIKIIHDGNSKKILESFGKGIQKSDNLPKMML